MKCREEVGDMPVEDAEEFCEEKDGDFVRVNGEIYIEWEEEK